MLNLGDKFQIKKFYGKRVMTVDAITADGFRCTDEVGDTFFFGTGAFELYSELGQLKIVSRPKFNHKLLQTATAQVTAKAISFNDEVSGAKLWTAIEKANKEIKENNTIKFEDGVLSFISRFSNEPRFVTKDGCSGLCTCKNQISYHKSIFDILTRYFELQIETKVRQFPVRENVEIRRAA